jgi:flagellar biosynthetic protein FliP
MIPVIKPIRYLAPLLIVIISLVGSADAYQSPLAPMPIGVNDSVSIEGTTGSIPKVPPAIIFEQPQSESVRVADAGSAAEAGKPQETSEASGSELSDLISSQAEGLATPESLPSSIKLAVVLGVLSLAPAIILMSTCYVRIIVVLTLLRQAFGVQQLPPTQVLTALSLFVTLLVMAPVWTEVKTEAIDPYTRAENPISWEEAWDSGVAPMKRFMLKQIRIAKNEDSIAVFYQNLPQSSASENSPHNLPLPTELDEVPVNILLPAFLISELKVAFLLGFQIYLPFLILDLVVSSVTVSMGMVMLPPTMVSFPLKLILFVMVDGWNLVLGMLLQSFG